MCVPFGIDRAYLASVRANLPDEVRETVKLYLAGNINQRFSLASCSSWIPRNRRRARIARGASFRQGPHDAFRINAPCTARAPTNAYVSCREPRALAGNKRLVSRYQSRGADGLLTASFSRQSASRPSRTLTSAWLMIGSGRRVCPAPAREVSIHLGGVAWRPRLDRSQQPPHGREGVLNGRRHRVFCERAIRPEWHPGD